ncbi:tRNA 2-thiouridine(34) synthase MnmA [Thermodesulfobacterium sp. TA1]|uniref:tRNA 2-thiouridine(34) synthase MnmA n=1 Tax=Thermodesulfobacterium sp. TA1 TaxID=2234087 RepID=UPI0012326E10|nr:tRNA 2-thiouridine(34) synthase MnmA [Thermodesulfobacterium sp. TA1]QER42187.1 tRNA 2-thiouridine(34) synthase MnmA [Thermodesulfobacterium sp. TA1]
MKIAICLSGGVDSSFAAYLLKEQGFSLVGLTFKLFENQEEIEKAKMIAEKLEIPHHIIDLSHEFQAQIISYFVKTYQEGKTPNPCALCNRKIKFGKVLEWALKTLKVEKLATGHYVGLEAYQGEVLLKKAKDHKKDQSYFLSLITKEALPFLTFPLNGYLKEDIKNLAKKIFNLETSKESQDVCFLKGKSIKEFLSLFLNPQKGPIVYKDRVVGQHEGIFFYTIGQRKGLRIPLGKPLYIIRLEAKTNTVFLGEKEDLAAKGVVLENLNLHLPINRWTSPEAQIRYRAPLVKVKDVVQKEEKTEVYFKEPVFGVTPGQVCAFYEKDFLLGGGIIVDKL